MHKAIELPKEGFKREVEKHLTGQETEPWEIIYFKLYKSQLPVIERALETAALMLGTSKSRGYCFEMICADFLAGAHLEGGNPDSLLFALGRLYSLLTDPQKTEFVQANGESLMADLQPRGPRLRLDPDSYRKLRAEMLERDGWRCQSCGSSNCLQVHHICSRSRLGDDADENLITLCADCHSDIHRSGLMLR